MKKQGGRPLAQLPGRRFHGSVDAGVSPATANVASHPRINVLVGRVRDIVEQRGRTHYLPRLAVATLRYVVLKPSLLYGVVRRFQTSLRWWLLYSQPR